MQTTTPPPVPAPPRLVTVQELADELRMTRWVVWKWIREGKLKAVRVGGRHYRIPQSERCRLLGIEP